MFLWFSPPSIAEKIPWLPQAHLDQELLRLQDDAPAGPPTALLLGQGQWCSNGHNGL